MSFFEDLYNSVVPKLSFLSPNKSTNESTNQSMEIDSCGDDLPQVAERSNAGEPKVLSPASNHPVLQDNFQSPVASPFEPVFPANILPIPASSLDPVLGVDSAGASPDIANATACSSAITVSRLEQSLPFEGRPTAILASSTTAPTGDLAIVAALLDVLLDRVSDAVIESPTGTSGVTTSPSSSSVFCLVGTESGDLTKPDLALATNTSLESTQNLNLATHPVLQPITSAGSSDQPPAEPVILSNEAKVGSIPVGTDIAVRDSASSKADLPATSRPPVPTNLDVVPALSETDATSDALGNVSCDNAVATSDPASEAACVMATGAPVGVEEVPLGGGGSSGYNIDWDNLEAYDPFQPRNQSVCDSPGSQRKTTPKPKKLSAGVRAKEAAKAAAVGKAASSSTTASDGKNQNQGETEPHEATECPPRDADNNPSVTEMPPGGAPSESVPGSDANSNIKNENDSGMTAEAEANKFKTFTKSDTDRFKTYTKSSSPKLAHKDGQNVSSDAKTTPVASKEEPSVPVPAESVVESGSAQQPPVVSSGSDAKVDAKMVGSKKRALPASNEASVPEIKTAQAQENLEGAKSPDSMATNKKESQSPASKALRPANQTAVVQPMIASREKSTRSPATPVTSPGSKEKLLSSSQAGGGSVGGSGGGQQLSTTPSKQPHEETFESAASNLSDEEFVMASSDLFDDPSALDYLSRLGVSGGPGSAGYVESDLYRQSLYVKFDPLVKGPSPQQPANHPGAKTPLSSGSSQLGLPPDDPRVSLVRSTDEAITSEYADLDGDDLLLMKTPPNAPLPNTVATVQQSKQHQPGSPQTVVKKASSRARVANKGRAQPAQNLGGTGSPQPDLVATVASAQKGAVGARAAAPKFLLDETLTEPGFENSAGSVPTSQLEQLSQTLRLQFQADLVSRENEFSARLREKEKLLQEKEEEILGVKASNQELNTVIAEYEKIIQKQLVESQRSKSDPSEPIEDIIKQRDQAIEDLAGVEASFTELHRRYEKLKSTTDEFKGNEENLKKKLSDYQTRLRKAEDRFHRLKEQAEDKLDKANNEIDRLQMLRETDTLGLRAQLKKADVQIESLERSLDQKNKEIIELTAICDELIAKAAGQRKE